MSIYITVGLILYLGVVALMMAQAERVRRRWTRAAEEREAAEPQRRRVACGCGNYRYRLAHDYGELSKLVCARCGHALLVPSAGCVAADGD